MSNRFVHLGRHVGERIWTPMGEGVLVRVAEDYVTVLLASDGTKMRYYDPAVVLLFADSSLGPDKTELAAQGLPNTEITVPRSS